MSSFAPSSSKQNIAVKSTIRDLGIRAPLKEEMCPVSF